MQTQVDYVLLPSLHVFLMVIVFVAMDISHVISVLCKCYFTQEATSLTFNRITWYLVLSSTKNRNRW